MQLEGLGNRKKFVHLIGSRTRDLPACSIAPRVACENRDVSLRCKDRGTVRALESSGLQRLGGTAVSERHEWLRHCATKTGRLQLRDPMR
jgi:hypothetical protein